MKKKFFKEKKMFFVLSIILTVSMFAGCTAGGLPQAKKASASTDGKNGVKVDYNTKPEFAYEHKTNFSVMTIGTGTPQITMDRSKPSTLVQYNGKYFLVDVGAGTTYNLCKVGIPIKDIKNLLLTHLHVDHVGGYTEFLFSSFASGRNVLNLIGTPGTKKLHETTLDALHGDVMTKTRNGENTAGLSTNINIKELEGKNTFDLDGVKISTAEMTHVVYNIGYRFDADGKSIVVSGDTSYDEDLITLAKDADILVMDTLNCYIKNGVDNNIGKPIKKGETPSAQPPPLQPPPSLDGVKAAPPHPTSIEEIANMAKAANVKKLVLTHIGPFGVDEAATKAEYKKFYNGEVIISKDLMEISAY